MRAVFEVAKAVARLGPKVIVTGRTPAPTGDEPYLALDDNDFENFRKEEMIRRKKADPTLTPVKFREAFDERLGIQIIDSTDTDRIGIAFPCRDTSCRNHDVLPGAIRERL